MSAEAEQNWRSKCPLNIAMEILGDRWMLLILRDLLFTPATTFRDFQRSGEGIASNILADRLKRLLAWEIVESERSSVDARVISYRPTTKGLDLLPAIIELIIWAAKYEDTAATPKFLKRLQNDRDEFVSQIRSRFEV